MTNKGGFSWKRLLGISQAKSQLSKAIGVPLSKSGREQKLGRILTGGDGITLATGLATAARLREEVLGPKVRKATTSEPTELAVNETPEGDETARVDPGGWNLAKWGMAELEVLAVFQGRARRLPNMVAFRFGVGTLFIDEYRVGTMNAQVMFIVSKERKLVAVQITSPLNGESVGPVAAATLQQQFDYLRNGLAENYGPESSIGDQPAIQSWRRDWLLPHYVGAAYLPSPEKLRLFEPDVQNGRASVSVGQSVNGSQSKRARNPLRRDRAVCRCRISFT